MHDWIISKTDDPNTLHETETFGSRSTAPGSPCTGSAKPRVDGPHHQLVNHGSHVCHLVWDDRGLAAAAIAGLITGMVAMKNAMRAMDTKVATWTVPGIRFEHEVLIQTLNSLHRSSDTDE
ncbi:hypothetical protein BGX31_000835 [Mortierella sp. GBA43]|nr:hypothetical protein BGX31_000835 [Mortierella sp. GBA43]